MTQIIDELGAHVSTSGGVHLAPERAAEIGSSQVQIFTKVANQWREPVISEEVAAKFKEARAKHGIQTVVSHDSYLINLATWDPALAEKSLNSMICELTRCAALGVDYLVSHPGNATDGDFEAGIKRNAEAVSEALERVDGPTVFTFETTAGTGKVLGSSFEQMARLLDALRPSVQDRVGITVDTCHIFAAGYDIVESYEQVIEDLEKWIGIDRVKVFHINDSQHPLGSRKDRHAGIGEGFIGLEGFRHLMNDPRFRNVPKLLETPKGDNPAEADRENLKRLRDLRSEYGSSGVQEALDGIPGARERAEQGIRQVREGQGIPLEDL